MIKNKIKTVLACLIVPAVMFGMPQAASAALCTDSNGNPTTCIKGAGAGAAPSSAELQKQINNNKIVKRINEGVTFLSAVVGIVIVGNLIAGGVQYSTAGGNAQKVTEARKRIANSFVAMFFFLLLWAFAQWLIPGGVFG